MQTKATSPLMHFPLVDALAPPHVPAKGHRLTERHKFWSKLRKLCQNPIYLQLPTAMCTQLPHMPSRRLAQCNLQRQVPPILPHIKFEKVALSSSLTIVLLANAQRGINSGGEGVAWAASRNLQRIPREGSQILCLFRLRLCPTKNVRRGAQKI